MAQSIVQVLIHSILFRSVDRCTHSIGLSNTRHSFNRSPYQHILCQTRNLFTIGPSGRTVRFVIFHVVEPTSRTLPLKPFGCVTPSNAYTIRSNYLLEPFGPSVQSNSSDTLFLPPKPFGRTTRSKHGVKIIRSDRSVEPFRRTIQPKHWVGQTTPRFRQVIHRSFPQLTI